jgi:hypothetical protein
MAHRGAREWLADLLVQTGRGDEAENWRARMERTKDSDGQ